jgi:hypothetical protein
MVEVLSAVKNKPVGQLSMVVCISGMRIFR